MLPFGAHSRRALAAAVLPLAFGPGAQARQRQPAPPLAFVKAVITDVGPAASGGGFAVSFVAHLHHPESAFPRTLSGQTAVDAATGATQVRAFVATALRSKASVELGQAGFAVPPDRVSVVLF